MKKEYKLTSFGIWLKCRLAEQQMLQNDLAKKVGVTEASVSRWIHGERTPRFNELLKILDIFGYSIEKKER